MEKKLKVNRRKMKAKNFRRQGQKWRKNMRKMKFVEKGAKNEDKIDRKIDFCSGNLP